MSVFKRDGESGETALKSKIARLYKDLYEISADRSWSDHGDQPSFPFVPYSTHYSENPSADVQQTELVWYGAATNGWVASTTDFDLAKASQETFDWISDPEVGIDRWKGRSLFWRTFEGAALELGIGELTHAVSTGAVWNNILKIGSETSNNGLPKAGLLRAQSKICSHLFKLELELFRPRVVVLHTGGLVNDHLFYQLIDWSQAEKSNDGLCWFVKTGDHLFVWLSRRPSVKTKTMLDHFKNAPSKSDTNPIE